MRGRRIRRGIVVAAGGALLASAGFFPGLARASGGGGCGQPITDARGSSVVIRDFCFGPTILRTRPGQTVTFVNKDWAPHTVLGANAIWGGFDGLRRGRDAAYRFSRPGVYPYVCTYHAGMVGAVVVGNGRGPGAAHTMTTKSGPVIHVTPDREPAPADVAAAQPFTPLDRGPAPTSTQPGATVEIVTGAGLLLAIAAAFVIERRRRLMASERPTEAQRAI